MFAIRIESTIRTIWQNKGMFMLIHRAMSIEHHERKRRPQKRFKLNSSVERGDAPIVNCDQKIEQTISNVSMYIQMAGQMASVFGQRTNDKRRTQTNSMHFYI